MSGQRKNNMPLTQNGVLTEEATLAYLKGELSPKDTAEFEKLLASDPFAREALEGLHTANIPKLKATFAEISHKIQDQSGSAKSESKKSFTLFFQYAAVAALVAIFIGVAFFTTNYFNEQAQKLALNEKGQETIAQEATPLFHEADSQILQSETLNTPDSLPSIEKSLVTQNFEHEISSIADSNLHATNADIAAKQQTIAPKTTAPLMPPPPVSTKQTEKTPAEKTQVKKPEKEIAKQANTAQTKTVQTTTNNTPKAGTQADATASSTIQSNVSTSKNTVVESAEKHSESMDDAMNSFNNRDYKDAAKKFSKISSKDPSNLDAIYFEGISQFINGDNNKALKNFDKLLNTGAKHSDGSKWYKAQILLKKGKKEEAKKLLNELKEGNSSFKERAIKKLNEAE